MKTIDISGDIVTYYFKDENGETIATTLNPADKECIERAINKGDMKGKLPVKQDITLFWSVEF